MTVSPTAQADLIETLAAVAELRADQKIRCRGTLTPGNPSIYRHASPPHPPFHATHTHTLAHTPQLAKTLGETSSWDTPSPPNNNNNINPTTPDNLPIGQNPSATDENFLQTAGRDTQCRGFGLSNFPAWQVVQVHYCCQVRPPPPGTLNQHASNTPAWSFA